MRTVGRFTPCLVFLITLMAAFVSASQVLALSGTVSVELSDGHVFDDVDFRVDKTDRILTVYFESESVKVSFAEVAAIIDENGKDVTEIVLGNAWREARWAAGDAAFPSTEECRGILHPDRQYRFGVQVNACYTLSAGRWYSIYDPGVGFGLDAFYMFSDEFAVRLSISKSGLKYDLRGDLEDDQLIVSNSLRTYVMRYHFGVQYSRWVGKYGRSTTMYSFYGGLGLVTHSFGGQALVYDAGGPNEYLLFKDDRMYAKPGVLFGGNLVSMFARNAGVQAGFRIDIVFLQGQALGKRDKFFNINASLASLYDLQLGLVRFF